jgi:hypothetical protein
MRQIILLQRKKNDVIVYRRVCDGKNKYKLTGLPPVGREDDMPLFFLIKKDKR